MLTLLAIFVSANTVALKFQSAKALFVFNVSSSMRLLFSVTGMKHYRAAPVPTEINFPRYNMKCSGGNVILCGIVHVFHYITRTCYIAEICITFRTVHSAWLFAEKMTFWDIHWCKMGCIVGWVNLYQKCEIKKYTVCGKLILPKKWKGI